MMIPMVEAAERAWQVKCREEDMRQRQAENFRREVDDARRAVDEKAEQLKAISQLSALIAGFAMVVMVEITYPEDLHLGLLTSFGATSAGVVALMFISMLNCSMMLIAILKFDCQKREPDFETYWQNWCENDWRIAYGAFTFGVPLFLLVLAQLGWIIFQKYPASERNVAASVVSVIAFGTSAWWFLHVSSKWRGNRHLSAQSERGDIHHAN